MTGLFEDSKRTIVINTKFPEYTIRNVYKELIKPHKPRKRVLVVSSYLYDRLKKENII